MNNNIQKIKDNVKKVIVANDTTIDMLLTATLVGGHILLEDTPGTGKTMLAKAYARSIGGSFSRIQFTPDLLPSDITGIYYYNKKEEDFIFRAGPAFADVVLADEINRATPRTQSALLECMEEKQITIEGNTHSLNDSFLVIATENPIESSGTFPLPEAELDRFLMRLSMDKPTGADSLAILNRFDKENPLDTLESAVSLEDIATMKKEASEVKVHESLKKYILEIINATNNNADITCGASTRAMVALYKCSKAYAYLSGRDYVIPEDIKFLAPKVISHRLIMARGAKLNAKKAEEVTAKVVGNVAVPTEEWK